MNTSMSMNASTGTRTLCLWYDEKWLRPRLISRSTAAMASRLDLARLCASCCAMAIKTFIIVTRSSHYSPASTSALASVPAPASTSASSWSYNSCITCVHTSVFRSCNVLFCFVVASLLLLFFLFYIFFSG